MTLTSTERLKATLAHRQPDRVCVDFGSTHVTGISASALTRLRHVLIGDDGKKIKVHEPYQMLGMIEDDMLEALGVDTVGVMGKGTMFGFENKNWKPFTMFDGTEVLVAGDFNVTEDEKGGLHIYPEGDRSVPPSGYMPRGGFYFDSTRRQGPINDDHLNVEDNLQEFAPLSKEAIAWYRARADEAVAKGKGAVLSAPGTAFGDIALVPVPWIKHPRGIRDVEEWYMSTIMRRDYVYEVFERQCAIALENLQRLIDALGNSIQAVFTTGTDFGTQCAPFISNEVYRDLFKPFHKQVNDFIHQHSDWKVFMHSCGSVRALIPEFIEAGFDILNPVQCSATGMNAQELKNEYGKDLIFWGGGVDTQKTFPFGSPSEVYDEVRRRIAIFNDGGGYVFNTIHNIQATTPIENMEAMVRALQDSHKG